MAMRRRAVLLTIVLITACSGSTNERTLAGVASDVCPPISAQYRRFFEANDATESRRAAERLIELQERAVTRLAEVADQSAEEPTIERYLGELRRLTAVERDALAADPGTEDALRTSVSVSEAEVESLLAKQAAEIPEDCPPADADQVYGALFVARADLACFALGEDLERLGELAIRADTRSESVELLRAAERLGSALARGFRASLPPELQSDTATNLVELYEERVQSLADLRRAFARQDRPAYDAAAARERRTASAIEQANASFGLDQCTNFIGVEAT
jgi:hypothetical protein